MTRLLLIDDDETTREVLLLLLTGEGWDVTEATGGEEGVAKARATQPEVILSDLQMPGLHGAELATELRLACKGPVTILAMTATQRGDAPAGFDALLVKPFDAAAIRRACETRVAEEAASPTQMDSDGEPVIAEEIFERIRRSMPAEQLRSLYDFALADAEMRVQRMQEAAAGGDDARFRKEAHALKGSCGIIGATRLRRLAATAETCGITTPLMKSNLSEEFRRAIEQIRLMLVGLLSRDN